MTDDARLLREYVTTRSQDAFAQLARRYTDLVYSSAKRQLAGDAHLAEDVTQAVFIILAQKAKSVPAERPISGWLLKVTGYCAANARRQKGRRQSHEREAGHMAAATNQDEAAAWNDVAPLLDEGLNKLGRADRDALLLRFFEHKSLREIGAAMGTSEEAAQKRVTRAVEKLRDFFRRRGAATLSVAALTVMLESQAVQAAPATLAATVGSGAAAAPTAAAVAKGAVAAMTLHKAAAIAMVVVAALAVGGGMLRGKGKPPEWIRQRFATSNPTTTRTGARAGPGVATFLDGTTVEVLGISELDDTSSSLLGRLASLLPAVPSTAPATTRASTAVWWSADGSPVDGSGFPAPTGNISLGDDAQMRRLRIVTTVRGDLGNGGNILIAMPASRSMIIDMRGAPTERFINCAVALPLDVERTDIRIGKSQGQWTALLDVPVKNPPGGPATRRSPFGAISEQDGQATVEFFTDRLKAPGGLDRRYVVVKTDGRRVMSRQMRGLESRFILFFQCKKDEVARIVVETRSLEWVTLSGVLVKPPSRAD